MSEASRTMRQKVHALAEELPPDASWDDATDEARFRKAVELGWVSQRLTEGLSLLTKRYATLLPGGR